MGMRVTRTVVVPVVDVLLGFAFRTIGSDLLTVRSRNGSPGNPSAAIGYRRVIFLQLGRGRPLASDFSYWLALL